MTDARSGFDHPGQPWIELGYCGGGIFKGKQFTSYDCFCQATLLDPDCPTAWCEVGCRGAVRMVCRYDGPRRCEERSVRCFARSVQCELDARHRRRCTCTCGGKAWACLAALGGGRLRSRTDNWHHVEPVTCIVNALECGWFRAVDKYVGDFVDGSFSEGRSMWCLLGCEGGAFFSGRLYSASMCYAEAVKQDPSDALAWLYLGQEKGGSIFGGRWACYQKARHLSQEFDRICALAECRNPLKCSLH